MSDGDPYVYPGSDVLRNKAGIRDVELLQQYEYARSGQRALQLAASQVRGHFDLRHLQSIQLIKRRVQGSGAILEVLFRPRPRPCSCGLAFNGLPCSCSSWARSSGCLMCRTLADAAGRLLTFDMINARR